MLNNTTRTRYAQANDALAQENTEILLLEKIHSDDIRKDSLIYDLFTSTEDSLRKACKSMSNHVWIERR